MEIVEFASDVPLRSRFSIDQTAINDREIPGARLDDQLVHSPRPHTLRRSFLTLDAAQVAEHLFERDGVWRLEDSLGEVWRARSVLFCPTRCIPREYPRGARELLGHGVSACARSDAAFFAGRRVVVAGAGDRALETALFASEFAAEVLVCSRGAPAWRASLRRKVATSDRIDVASDASVLAVEGAPDGKVSGVRIRRDGADERVECAAMRVAHPLILSDAATAFAGRLMDGHDPDRAQIAGVAAGVGLDDDHGRLVDDALRAARALRYRGSRPQLRFPRPSRNAELRYLREPEPIHFPEDAEVAEGKRRLVLRTFLFRVLQFALGPTPAPERDAARALLRATRQVRGGPRAVVVLGQRPLVEAPVHRNEDGPRKWATLAAPPLHPASE